MRSFHRTSVGVFAIAVALGVGVACGTSGPGGLGGGDGGDGGSDGSSGFHFDGGFDGGGNYTGDGAVRALAFNVPALRLEVTDDTLPTAQLSITATMPDGSTQTVTPHSLQFDRPDIATATVGAPVVVKATGELGGTGTLHAIFGGVEATVKVTVVVRRRLLGTVSAADATKLDAASATDKGVTSLLYPYDGTVFPLGLIGPQVMWTAPTGASATSTYRLRLEEANYTVDQYATVSAPGRLRIDQLMWDRLTASNAGGASDPLKVTLSRLDSTGAYVSARQTWTIAPANVRGAIYYWTTFGLDANEGHLSRLAPGTGAKPTQLYNGTCMGCHAVSADGSTLVAAVESQQTVAPYTNGWSERRGWMSFNLPAGTVRRSTNMYGGNLAVTPDGKYTLFGGRGSDRSLPPLNLADTATGAVLESGLRSVNLGGLTALMAPAFSPDGKLVAAIGSTDDGVDNVIPNNGNTLVYLNFDPATHTFGNTLHRLATLTDFPAARRMLNYPTFTPDSKWIAYHAGDHSTGCYDQCDLDNDRIVGDLYIQNLAGGRPIALDKINLAPRTHDQHLCAEPTFNPDSRGGYSWVVFTSSRDYGNQLSTTLAPPTNRYRRLWVAAVDSTIGTTDPSHPPFYLEGQEDTPNMRGFWALAACIKTPREGQAPTKCTAGFECCSGFCREGTCVDLTELSCVGVGGTCTTTSECCNAEFVSCVAGTCTPVAIQ